MPFCRDDLHISYRVVIYMQMINGLDITTGYSAAQAAELLGVQTHEVTRLFRAGVLKGQKVAGGALLLDAGCVQSYKSNSRGKGRPWDAQTAWAALLLLDGKDVSWLPYHRKRRLLEKLESISAEDLVWLARKRATAEVYSVSQSFADDVRASLAQSGMSASSSAGMGLVSSARIIDGYAREADVVEKYYMMPDQGGNCIIRTAEGAPAGLLEEAEMPTTVVAADLAMSLDEREKRCGLDYLRGALDAIC